MLGLEGKGGWGSCNLGRGVRVKWEEEDKFGEDWSGFLEGFVVIWGN